jgi:hypothetical protein
MLSCGAALEHLRIAMHAFGCRDELELFPYAQQPDFLARLRLVDSATPADEKLFEAIAHRHTNRKLFSPRPIEKNLLETLQSEAQQEGVWLHFFSDSTERDVVAGLIAVGDDIQSCNKDARNDIADWMSPNDGVRRDGIPGYAQGISDGSSYVAAFWTRIFGPVVSQADYDWTLANNAPVLAVLGTNEEGPQHWLAAGRALARILLHATAERLSASFFSQPIQVDSLWSELRRLIRHSGVPQLVFRLGYAEEEALPTPRRDVEDVSLDSVPSKGKP